MRRGSRGARTIVRYAASALLASGCADRSVPQDAAPSHTRPAALTNRVWLATDASPPGAMLIFLSDGTLVQDSCWETYRLSRWRSVGGLSLRWEEDTAEIAATVVSLDDSALTLRLDLPDGAVQREFVAAAVPYVCPDMPR